MINRTSNLNPNENFHDGVPGLGPVERKRRFPWVTIILLLVIVGMSIGNMWIDEARRTYKKGFEELRKTCADQNQLLKEQHELLKEKHVSDEKFKADTAYVAISAYNLGYAHFPPDQFLGVLTNHLGITNAVVEFFTNEAFGGENVTNMSITRNRREL